MMQPCRTCSNRFFHYKFFPYCEMCNKPKTWETAPQTYVDEPWERYGRD